MDEPVEDVPVGSNRSGEDGHPGPGRLVVFAIAVLVGAVMIWALYDGSARRDHPTEPSDVAAAIDGQPSGMEW